MLVAVLTSHTDFANTGHDIIRLFYPEARVVNQTDSGCDLVLSISSFHENGAITGQAKIISDENVFLEESVSSKDFNPEEIINQQKRLIKLALFRLLSRYTGKAPGPWGVLTGIRPTKIVHRLIDDGWKKENIINYLTNQYDMRIDKAELLTKVAFKQRKFLMDRKTAEKLVSIYVGIPFCPTRCAYCSFPAYPADKWGSLILPFIDALKKEIASIGDILRCQGKKVQTIYIGGGTPTVLDANNLSAVLKCINDFLVSENTVEITLEAGRPDTITVDKLNLAKEYGVTRLSINPQTMNLKTLQVIGRCHGPEEVAKAVELARISGFNSLNMDIILGLPGEKSRDVEKTLREVISFAPENLTVHTLAVKRASHINEAKDDFELPTGMDVAEMLDLTAKYAELSQLEPYYLYRQKNMLGQFENVGYAREGHECIYNVQVMEERQTIIGLGGGSGSKFLEPGNWYLKSHYNPKDPENYISRIDEIIEKKQVLIADCFV